MSKEKAKKAATLPLSILTLALIVAFIAAGVGVFQVNIAVTLFLSWLIVWAVAATMGYTFSDLEGFAYEMAKKCIVPAAIILAVGMMIASFMAAGTVPAILSAGLKVITPKFFLIITFVMCMIMSVLTGTSWGTLGTIGVAMMGVGTGLGVNPAITAGAIIGGAWFGDKMSPMSDSTIMCSTITGTRLMDHIKSMMQTTIPAAIIAGILYLIIGFTTTGSSYDHTVVDEILAGLNGIFNLNIVVLLPIVVVIALIVMKKGTVVALLSGTVFASLIAILFQGYSISQLGDFLYNGFACESGSEIVDSLLQRGGMSSLLSLLAVFVSGLGLGGMLDNTGLLQPILDAIKNHTKSPRSIMIAAWVATLLCIVVIPDNNFAFVMVGTLFAPIFRAYQVHTKNLSRVLEDVGTLGSALIPHNVGAQFAAGVLGVSTMAYLPYAFLNWITPIISLIFIIFQIKITKANPAEEHVEATV